MSIMSLLMPQAGADIGGGQGQITVTGNTPMERESSGPRYILEETRASPSYDEIAEVVPRQGMFGTKGTLRDVLGALADGFLTQSGNAPAYRERREQEKIGDAMYGFTQNPLEAIERLNAAGYADQGLQANQLYSQNKAREAQIAQAQASQERQQANTDSLIRGRDSDIFGEVQDYASRMIGQANGQNLPFILDRINTFASRNQISLEDLGLSNIDQWSEEDLQAYARGDMTVYQNESLGRRDTQLGISQQNADANTRRANRPPARRAARSPTRQEIYQSYSNVPSGDRTPEMQDYLDNYVGRDVPRRRGQSSSSNTPARRFGPPRN